MGEATNLGSPPCFFVQFFFFRESAKTHPVYLVKKGQLYKSAGDVWSDSTGTWCRFSGGDELMKIRVNPAVPSIPQAAWRDI